MRLYSGISSSLIRHFPHTSGQWPRPSPIEVALNEQFSFQVFMRLEGDHVEQIRIQVEGPEKWSIRVRRVGVVPVLHHNRPENESSTDIDGVGHIPGYVPDPLFDESSILLPTGETHSFWVTVCPFSAREGYYTLKVRVFPEKGKEITHAVGVRLHDITIRKRSEFPVTHWFYLDCLLDWYKTDISDPRLWEILARYMRDMVQHGQDVIYVPLFTPPLDGVKRPCQLLKVKRTGANQYHFDWTDVRRYINLAKECGFTYFEWCHFFTQWGAEHAIGVYKDQGEEESLLWPADTPATAKTYRTFLSQCIPELKRFLLETETLDQSFFHVSDEPHGEEHLMNYQMACAMLKELAPWMKVIDAVGDPKFVSQTLMDMPISHIRNVFQFINDDIPCWCYYCSNPHSNYLHRHLDDPLPKIAMHGFLFYRWPLRGFLHWGYNYWLQGGTRNLIDPYTVQDGLRWPNWGYGDPFLVYPGPEGPVDSIRWEVFGESLQDYALLQTLGVDRDGTLLAPIKSFTDFPKNAKWRSEARRKLFELISR